MTTFPEISQVLAKELKEVEHSTKSSAYYPASQDQQIWHSKKFITHEQRIGIIYEHKIHGTSIMKISKNMERNYSTIFNIVQAYCDHGHTNRMRNFKEKVTLLKLKKEAA